jgi:plasmid stabilization system protein ParE
VGRYTLTLLAEDDLGDIGAYENLGPGLLRCESGRHVVFFRRSPDGVRVLRFLHERMLPELHDFDDEDVEP